MAKPNYQFEKRQRELEKKKKKAEKALKKSSGGHAASPAAEPDESQQPFDAQAVDAQPDGPADASTDARPASGEQTP